MSKRIDTGRDPSQKELAEAERVLNLSPAQQKNHPSAVAADPSKLSHINTYGSLPDFYVDRPFTCRQCGKRELWKAKDQKWYYEEAKGHMDAVAVECHACRQSKKPGGASGPGLGR
jgi:hypothetical protein